MMIPISPVLGGAFVFNATGRPATPIVPRSRILPPGSALKPAREPARARKSWAPPMAVVERERLPDPIPADVRARSVAPLVRLVAEEAGLRVGDVKGERRTAPVVKARQVAMWLAKRFAKRSLPEIGRAIGDRDHTTVLRGCRKVDEAAKALGAPDEDTPEAWAARLLGNPWPKRRGD